MAVRQANGQRFGGIPYGFDVAEDGKPLLPDQAAQAVIEDILAMRTSGATLQAIATALSDRGVPIKTGRSIRWSHHAPAQILSRRRMAGIIHRSTVRVYATTSRSFPVGSVSGT